jgi:alpha-tubulin suppressor-like RCC1 family protein
MGGASGTTGTPTHMTTLDGKNIVKVRVGANAGHAISSDGKVYAWGKNDRYQIPNGTNSNVTIPTEMTWFSRKNIKIVDIRPSHDTANLALDDQGNMYVWGKDDNGGLGSGAGGVQSGWPFLLKENIASISSGYAECGCIDKFGQVYTWGDAQQGQQNWIHGTNSDTDITHPTSNNLSVGSSVVYDGFDKYLLSKDSTVTSNVTFGSNTVSLGT